jgi:DNA primase
VRISSGKDAADLVKKDPQLLLKAVAEAKGAMEYFFHNIFTKYNKENVEDEKKITQELLEMVGYLANNVEKNHWLKKIASELNISDSILTDMLKKTSLRDRAVQTSPDNASREDKIFAPSGKIETLVKDLIGLMLVYPAVWKVVVAKKDRTYLPKNSLLENMLQRGAEFNFSFDELTRKINSSVDKSQAEKIYFAMRYRVGLDNSLEEIVIENPSIEAQSRLREIRYEANKNSLDKISKDLDAAKKNKDEVAINFLKEEYLKINSEQSLLNKELN